MDRRTHATPPRCRHGVRGFGLLDAMVALVILTFGLLGMSRFQNRTIASTTEAATRTIALGFSDELLSTVLVDAGNAACYSKPAAGVCGSAAAQARVTDWATRTAAALPGPVTTTATLGASGRFTVTITWKGKESQETRTLEAATDVRT